MLDECSGEVDKFHAGKMVSDEREQAKAHGMSDGSPSNPKTTLKRVPILSGC